MKNIKHAVLKPTDSILNAAKLIDTAVSSGGASGIAVVLDECDFILGVVSDGDIRDAICKGLDLSQSVELIMNKNPVVIDEDFDEVSTAIKRVLKEVGNRAYAISKIISVDANRKFKDILDVNSLIVDYVDKTYSIRIYGLGFVGLTLGVTFAEHDSFRVQGIDTNSEVIESLKSGRPHFYEHGLKPLLSSLVRDNRIDFRTLGEVGAEPADVHIVSVGTPLDESGNPDTSFLESAAKSIGETLIHGNLVICRSTVPLGTMRNYFIPLVEKHSAGLRAGIDFNVAFCPERTVEGDALRELRELPQIVGGLTPKCTEMAANIFQPLGPVIVKVESLEAAELVKLINNSFRDLCFAFSNEVALVCDKYNVDAFELISAANKGYPRNKIPKPSPGVGGICLSKDPFLYAASQQVAVGQQYPKLPILSREINTEGALYPVEMIAKFVSKYGLIKKKLKILIVGVAFKGEPETSDIRYSSSVATMKKLQELGHGVSLYDAIVPREVMIQTGCDVFESIEDGINGMDVVLFLNNHKRNLDFDYERAFSSMSDRALLFDGWKQFTKEQFRSYTNIIYSTMGYID